MSPDVEDLVLWVGSKAPLPAEVKDLSKLGELQIHIGRFKTSEEIWRKYVLPHLGRRRVWIVPVLPAQFKVHLLAHVKKARDVYMVEVLRNKVMESEYYQECGYKLQELDRDRCWIASTDGICAVFCYRGLAVVRELKLEVMPLAV